jgi:hypothetical protein
MERNHQMTKPPPKIATDSSWSPQGPYKGPTATAVPQAVEPVSVVQPSFLSDRPSPEDYPSPKDIIELLRSIDRRLAAIEKKLP